MHFNLRAWAAFALVVPTLAWAHGGAQQPADWPFSPDILLGTLLAAAIYLRGWWRRRGRPSAPSAWRHASFFAGLGALLAALQSPIDTLAEHSFAMHQVQHLLLRGIAPMLLFLALPQPLMVAGLPRTMRKRVLAPLFASRSWRLVAALFARPFPATFWLLAVPYFWHIPRFHDLSVLRDPVHYAMHLSMLLPALLFCWRVLDPRPAPLGASYATRAVMCWAAIAGTIPLGAFLSLKRVPLYASYDLNGRIWDLGALQDELIGGVIVWIPGSMMFFVLLLLVIRLWGAREGRVEALRQRGIAAPTALDVGTANRALALRLAGIAATVACAVVAVVVVARLLP